MVNLKISSVAYKRFSKSSAKSNYSVGTTVPEVEAPVKSNALPAAFVIASTFFCVNLIPPKFTKSPKTTAAGN